MHQDSAIALTRVGGGLEIAYHALLATPNHGGVKLQIASSNPAIALVAPDVTTPGQAVIEVDVPDGQSYCYFVIQGVLGATGNITVTATAPRFSRGSLALNTVPPVFYLEGLPSSTTTLSADTPFYTYTGIRNAAGTAWERVQVVSAAAAPLVVTFSSSTPAVGEVKTTAAHGASVTVAMPANTYYTPTSVVAGGVAFDPVGGGTTTVTASAPGFAAFNTASQVVTVTQPTIDVTDAWGNGTRVGAGLQTYYRVTLGGANHGGVTVRIQSSNAAVALVAPDSTTSGSATIDVTIPNGQTYYDFYVQGVSGKTGTAVISASQALFAPGATLTVTVVPPVFYLGGLPSTTTSLSADSPFYAYTYIRNADGTQLERAQVVSAAAAPLVVTFTSSTPAVGEVKTTAAHGASVTVAMPAGTYYTPTSVAAGGVAFDPVGGGTTTVTASAPGFAAFSTASQTVTVTQPTIDVTDVYGSGTRVGAGLQTYYRVTLGGANHGGVTVRIQSSNVAVALVAPDGATPGSATIDITIPDGQTYYDFYVQGVSGTTGTAVISASQALFAAGATLTVQVVPPVFSLGGLPGSTTTLSTDTPFYVYTYILNAAGTALERVQYVSAAAAPLVVTFSSSNTAVGEVKTTAAHGASVTVAMPAGTYYTPTSVAAGGVAFDPVGGGTTTVTASAPGFAAFSTASQVVTVTQPTIDVTDAWGNGTRVGAGLQTYYRVTLGGANHGGVTVRIASNAPDVARVAQDATTPGTSFIDVFIPDGQSYYDFYVQGVSGKTGTAVISASQALFAAGATLTIQVVPPVFYLAGLPSTTTSLSADTPFYAETGTPNAAGTAWERVQYVSAAAPLVVTFSSSNPAAGEVKTAAAHGTSVTVVMPANTYYTPTSVEAGGVAFDPVGVGTTTVTATAPGFASFPTTDSQTVTVSP